MQAQSIEFTNFGSFSYVKKDLRNMDLVGIVGRYQNDDSKSNGAGKSHFLEAILFALYSRCRTKSPDSLVKEGTGEMSVDYQFIANGRYIQVVRGWKKGKKSKGGLIVKVDGEFKADGSLVGDPLIVDLVGVDYETFIATSFFEQEKADVFTSATAGKRKEYIRKIDNLDIFDKARKLSANKVNEVEQSIDGVKSKIDMLNERVSIINEEEIQEETNILKMCNEEMRCELQELEKKQAEHLINEEKMKRMDQLIIDLREAKEQDYKVKIVKLQEEIKVHEKVIATSYEELNKLSIRMKDFDALPEYIISPEEMKEIESELEKARQKHANLQAQANIYVDTIVPMIDALKDEIVKWKKTEVCMECGSVITAEVQKCKLNKIQKEIDEFSDKDVNVEEVKRATEIFQHINTNIMSIYEQIKQLEQKQTNKDVIKAEISMVNNDVKIHTEAIETAKAHIADMIKYQGQLERKIERIIKEQKNIKVVEGIKDNSSDIAVRRDKISENDINLGVLKADLFQFRKDKIEVKQLSIQVKEDEILLNMYKALEYALGKDGIPNLIIENTLIDIEQMANEILGEIVPEMKIFFETTKDTKKGEIAETLDILIEHNGGVREYETFSGGERTLINFSIRFAISQYLSQKGDKRVEVVFLDEVFSSLDTNNMNLVVSVLQSLRKQFKQIFCISHREIQGLFPHTITVEKNAEGSRIL